MHNASFTLEWVTTHQKHIQNDAYSPHINFLSVNAILSKALRSYEGNRARCSCDHEEVVAFWNFLGDIKVNENYALFVFGYQDVGGLDVSMAHVRLMQVGDTLEQLLVKRLHVLLIVGTGVCQIIKDLLALNVLHDLLYLILEFVIEHFNYSHNVSVFQSVQNLELPLVRLDLLQVV